MRNSIFMTMCLATLAACGGEETTSEGAATEGAATEGAASEGAAPAEAPAAAQTAAQVAEAYLRAGSTEDAAAIAAALDPECASLPSATRVDAVRVMGAPITIETLTVEVASEEGDDARVSYEVAGSAHSEGGTTQLFGATVQTGAVNIDDASQSGTLSMRRIDGHWRVGCR